MSKCPNYQVCHTYTRDGKLCETCKQQIGQQSPICIDQRAENKPLWLRRKANNKKLDNMHQKSEAE